MIDMHAHWRPAEIADALRARTKEPRIVRNQDGVEVLKRRMGEEPLAKAFDDVEFHLARMDRQGVRPACCRCSARSAGSSRSRWRCRGRCAASSTTGCRGSARNRAASPPSPRCR